jgi:hypothetical protein
MSPIARIALLPLPPGWTVRASEQSARSRPRSRSALSMDAGVPLEGSGAAGTVDVMSDEHAVLSAAVARAAALSRGNAADLERWLHPQFCWTSHTGERFDRRTYIESNVGTGAIRWHAQHLDDVSVSVVADTAVVRCTVRDDVETGDGRRIYRMPVTQTWCVTTVAGCASRGTPDQGSRRTSAPGSAAPLGERVAGVSGCLLF